MKNKLTLRKGHVIKKMHTALYLIKDCHNENEIYASLSGKQLEEGLSLEIDDIAYVVVHPSEMTRGRILNSRRHYRSDYHLKQEKFHLDNGHDPLLEENS